MTHVFSSKVLNWCFCSKCGLIQLKNAKTQKAVSQECPGKRHDVRVSYSAGADQEWRRLKAAGWL